MHGGPAGAEESFFGFGRKNREATFFALPLRSMAIQTSKGCGYDLLLAKGNAKKAFLRSSTRLDKLELWPG